MSSLRKSLTTGIFYSALSKYSGIVVAIFIGAVLARLLTPKEFGIVALVTVFVTFFNLLGDFGLGPAVVQDQSLEDEDIRSIFSFSVLLGFALSFLFLASAPLIARFYDEPELLTISQLLSLSVLFNSALVIPRALFRKALKFKQIGLITLSVQLSCGLIAILMAYAGFSYYALVFQSILVGVISFVVFYLINPIKFSTKINWPSIKKIIRFSSFQFLFNFINYFSRNSDNILIGRFMGTTSLGYYDKAYRLMMLPIGNLTHVITPVLMPVLTRHQEDKIFIFQSYSKVVKLLANVGFPLSVFLYFSATEIINIMFGPQWIQSVPVFQLLSLTVGIQMVLSSSGAIFQAMNRTDLLFTSGLLSAFTMISGISYGIFIGKSLEAIGHGLILAFFINFFQGFYILIAKVLKISFVRFLGLFRIPLLMSILLAICLWLFKKVEPNYLVLSLASKMIITVVFIIPLVHKDLKFRTLLK